MRIRRSVWTLQPLDANVGTPWDSLLEWYARGVAHMQTRPIDDPRSWRYQAAIHGYTPGQPPNTEPVQALPSSAERAKFWSQCQHQSWFFLPWHRVYLAYFEQIVAAAIVEIGGPPGWALPYWNYSDANNPRACSLPPAFRLAQLPDGTANALRVITRNPACNAGQVLAGPAWVDLVTCLRETNFVGNAQGGNPGFGGPQTAVHHGGGNLPFGKLETVPHGSMHTAVGGFMRNFNTAGLDPLFWLHHANIDRLWQVWQLRNAAHTNPASPAWLTGQVFHFHDADGAAVSHTASEFLKTTTAPMPYDYDDVSDPLPAVDGDTPGMAAEAGVGRTVSDQAIPEMIGATADPILLTGQSARIRLALGEPTGPAAARLDAAAAGASRAVPLPEMYVNIENVTGSGQSESYEVYVNVPAGEEPRDHPELFAGLLPMFGLAEASRSDQDRPGDGLHYALDIGPIVRRLQADGRWNASDLQLTFVPESPAGSERDAAAAAAAPPVQPVRIGRVSLYVA